MIGYGPLGGCCGRGNEPSYSIKEGKCFLSRRRDLQYLMLCMVGKKKMIAECYVGCAEQLSGRGVIVGTTPVFAGAAEEVSKNRSQDSRSPRREVMRSRSATHSTATLCVTVIILYVFIFRSEVANRKNLNWFAEVAVVAKVTYLK